MVLPPPEGPMTATTVRGGMSNDTSFRTRLAPMATESPTADRTGAASGASLRLTGCARSGDE
jgi:hypothetical protein